MPTPTEELAILAKKAIDDVKEMSSAVTTSVSNLEKIREDYKNGLWSRFIQIIKILSPICIFALGIVFSHHIPCGTDINIAGLEISRTCALPS
jgi:hypothetical protein